MYRFLSEVDQVKVLTCILKVLLRSYSFIYPIMTLHVNALTMWRANLYISCDGQVYWLIYYVATLYLYPSKLKPVTSLTQRHAILTLPCCFSSTSSLLCFITGEGPLQSEDNRKTICLRAFLDLNTAVVLEKYDLKSYVLFSFLDLSRVINLYQGSFFVLKMPYKMQGFGSIVCKPYNKIDSLPFTGGLWLV